MEITEVRIALIGNGKESVRAFASITFDHCFVVRNLKVTEKENRFRIYMPDRKRKDGSTVDVAFPINNDMRKKIEIKILEKYEEELKKNIKNNLPS